MSFKKIFYSLALLVITASCAVATALPPQVKDFILKENPKASIRFDGLITYEDGTTYLPVIPSYLDKVDSLKISYTYPDKKSFSQSPEVVVFNNNYALLKVFKNPKGILTVTQSQSLPVAVKTGTLPQDLLVPKGLVLPENLKGILGNVEIPVLNANVVKEKTSFKPAPLPNKNDNSKTYSAINSKLKNKMFFVTNYDSQYLKVFSSGLPEPLYSLKIDGVPKDIKSVCNDKYLLVITNTEKCLSVVDIRFEYIAKQIDLGVLPDEIVVNNKVNKAYVSSIDDKSIFIIDLNDMKVEQKIKIIGVPQRLTISDDGSQLAYVDRSSSNVYILALDGTYENKLVANQSNISKILINNSKLYIIDRAKNSLNVIDYVIASQDQPKTDVAVSEKHSVKEGFMSGFKNAEFENASPSKKADMEKELILAPKTYATSQASFTVGVKPVDMLLYKDKLFVVCADQNEVAVFDIDSQKIVKTIKLPVTGFSKRITQIENSNIAVITNVLAKKYAVIDLDKANVLQSIGLNMPVNSITIVNKPVD